MGSMTKTDNANLELKVELRRRVLKAARFRRPLRVLDLYAGEGKIWRHLRAEFKLAGYTPCDIRPRMAGTLKANVTPLFVEAIASGHYNVIDIDTYGEPWATWAAVAHRIHQRAAIFLTHGVVGMGQTSHMALEAMGIPHAWKIPVKPHIARFAARFFIVPEFVKLRIESAWRAEAGNATYYGLVVSPLDKAKPPALSSAENNG
ncbi:MAG: hypothetical protein L0338_02390 [Acidobacteria bacterium]|nr:hypothetical protein [Acidobacteriota bacterium]